MSEQNSEITNAGLPAAVGQAEDAGAATGSARDVPQGAPGAAPGTAATGSASVEPQDHATVHREEEDQA